MAQSLIPEPVQSYEDSNGKPLNGGKLYTYAAGTLTAKATYQDSAGAIPNSNPIILSERGEATVYGSGNYRMILQNSLGAVIFDRDNVTAPTTASSLAGPNGASQVGYDDTTLDVQIKDRLNRVVNSIAALRGLNKTLYTRAWVTGYYAAGDGGGGAYWYDSSDTTSADNGGSVIVASDGGRWKLEFFGTLSVRQFGAKGDGVTDDRAAIQAAINVFSTNGGEVFLTDGEFAIGGVGLTIPNAVADFSGLQLRGSGQGTALKKIGTNNSLISILGGRATVRDLTLNGNNLAGSGIFNNTASNGYGTRVFNVGFVSMTDHGFFNNNGGSHSIHDCYFLNAGTWAIRSVNDMQNSSVSANLIQGSGGVQVDNSTFQCEGLRISDNTIFSTGGSNIHIEIIHGLEIYIHNNILDQGPGKCIRLRNNTSLVKITNNWISPSNSDEGVAIGDDVNSCTIQGNTFNGGLIQCSVGASSLGRVHSIQVLDNQFKTDGSGTPIQFVNITRSMVRGNITDDTSNSFVEAGGSNIISALNIFKVNQSVSGGVTTTGNIIA